MEKTICFQRKTDTRGHYPSIYHILSLLELSDIFSQDKMLCVLYAHGYKSITELSFLPHCDIIDWDGFTSLQTENQFTITQSRNKTIKMLYRPDTGA